MRRLLLSLALAGLIVSPAAGQIVQNQVSGNEVWVAQQGPGGPSSYIGINTVSGRTANIVGTISASATISSVLNQGGDFLVTAQPSAATLTFPPLPIPDGAIIRICNTTSSAWATNVVTVAGNTGQTSPTNATITTTAAGTCAGFQWNQASAKWYKVQ